MTELEGILMFLLVIFILAFLIVFKFAQKYHRQWKTRQTAAYYGGIMQTKGDIYQLLGTLACLEKYDQLIFLSTTSTYASLDLIGITDDSVDFLEFKTKGAGLTYKERKIERLIKECKVNYIVKDVELPQGLRVTDRPKQRKFNFLFKKSRPIRRRY